MLNVVLHQPEIPPNTGNIARLCLAAGARLHLIEPLGFALDDRALRRAGLDYWPEVDLQIWPGYEAFRASVPAGASVHLLSSKAARPYWEASFRDGDYIVLGPETRGLPCSLLESDPDACLRIPQQGARSLNLATAAGIVLYEAVRQLAHPD